MILFTHSTRRRGIGTVFLIAVAVVVVLVIMLMANSLFTSRVREQTVDVAVAERAATVSESSVEEAAYRLLKRLNDPESDDALYEAIRKFDPAGAGADPGGGPFRDGLSTTVRPELTQRAYEDADDVKAGDVEAGPFEQIPLSVIGESNESYGTFGFQNSAWVKAPGRFRSVEERVFFTKAYKVVLLAPPFPFNRTTVFLKDPRRFRTQFERYQVALEQAAAANATLPADQQITLPPWPLEDGGSTRPVLSTAASVPPEAFTAAGLAPEAGLSPQQLVASLAQRFQQIDAAFDRQPEEQAAEFETNRYYDQLELETVERQATHVFDNFAELVGLAGARGTLELNGYYLVRREVTLDQPWTGRGIIATEAGAGITVKSATRQGEGRLVLLAVNGPIDIGGLPPGETLKADLFAPNGELQGGTGKTIEGIVMVRDIAAAPDPFSPGPTIVRPPDSDYAPWKGGAADEAYMKQLAFFLDPGFLKREYVSRRERKTGTGTEE